MHGACAEDYVWQPAQQEWQCRPCGKTATDGHCNTDSHRNRIQWYGAAATEFNAAARNESRQPPSHCMVHYEVPSMYEYQKDSWNWRCKVCGVTATEGHCETPKHQKNVILLANKYRNGPRSSTNRDAIEAFLHNPNPLSEIRLGVFNEPLARWSHQVQAIGLNAQMVQQCFGAPGSSIPISHVMEFTESNRPPAFPQVMSFWGDVYCVMRETIQELSLQGGPFKGLWHFIGKESEWHNALVWSNADKETTRHSMGAREEGIWWPCIAVDVGDGTIATYCQDFAMQKSKEAWIAHPSRVLGFFKVPPPPPPPRQNAKEEEAAVSGLQPEAAADWGDTDSEEESVWTDEEEHKAWRRMTIEERLKNVKNMKRKFIWFSQQQEADNESALQPEARNDKLSPDILEYLQQHQLRHISHPCKNE